MRSSSPPGDEAGDENSSQAPSSASSGTPKPEAEGVQKTFKSLLDSMCPLDKKGKGKDEEDDDEDDDEQKRKPRKGKARKAAQDKDKVEDPEVQPAFNHA